MSAATGRIEPRHPDDVEAGQVDTDERCEVCGNTYDKALHVTVPGDAREHVFDSFECAIQALAPHCGHCGCRIMGHGVEAGDTMYCCAHCARHKGAAGISDRA